MLRLKRHSDLSMTLNTQTKLKYPTLNRRKIEVEYCIGNSTSDGGVLLLRDIDKKIDLQEAVDSIRIHATRFKLFTAKCDNLSISLDGKGSWRHEFFGRPWRAVIYDHVYLLACELTSEAKSKIANYFDLYNRHWLHSKFDWKASDRVYFESLPRITRDY